MPSLPSPSAPVSVPTPAAIEVADATKVIDGVTVLDRVSFTARPGRVTAFLGPNGAGKSTTLRAILGIDHLTSGTATIGGRRFHEHHRPAAVIGALLTPDAIHPRRTARGHLSVVAASNGLPRASVAKTIELVGITEIADLEAGQMSLGMRQRLSLATALIGEPAAVILDEPHNGLDAAAIRWLRVVLRQLADSGRTVLLSSHLMPEIELVADDVVVIDRGSIQADATLPEFLSGPDVSLEDRYLDLVGEA
ncbi:MAG: ATP-binding cassette domain-containing protein [Frankiaceae bacterium]|nr:ATP-binding cassette domain-containing protein [Frankiaceae bacterium]MBV9869280.1 ATP-binding cassette domain-containing protein [Frankiaceae bacterium]